MDNLWTPRRVTLKGFRQEIVLGRADRPPMVQSMLDTPGDDAEAGYAQILELHQAGCEAVRISVPNKKALGAAEAIAGRLENENIPHVLIADIHFAPHLAFDSLDVFHKVRLNPGNFVEKNQGRSGLLSDDEKNAIGDKLRAKYIPVLEKAKRLNRALRIGVNHGSLGDRMVQTWGDSPQGMVESAMEYLDIALEQGFADCVVSLKASNVLQMLEANTLFVAEAIKRDRQFPLHLGITEAGSGTPARLKSAQGIGYLLSYGVGETIRVSLAEDPVAEVPVAKDIANIAWQIFRERQVHQTNSDTQKSSPLPEGFGQVAGPYKDIELYSPQPLNLGEHLTSRPEAELPTDAPVLCLDPNNQTKRPDAFTGRPLEIAVCTIPHLLSSSPKNILAADAEALELASVLLQGARIRSYETEFIACPGCARTLFNLQTVTERIKGVFGGVPNLKIAVMGCIVNGPGEMADADYGYVGAGPGRIDLYRGRDVVRKGLHPDESLQALADLIREDHPDYEFPAAYSAPVQ